MKLAPLFLLTLVACSHTQAPDMTYIRLPKELKEFTTAEKERRSALYAQAAMANAALRESTGKDMVCWIGFNREIDGLPVTAAMDCRILIEEVDPDSLYEFIVIWVFIDKKWTMIDSYN